MLLFEENEMFTTGSDLRKRFDLPDLGLMLHEGFIPQAEADYYYKHLLEATPWRAYQMPMYDKMVTAPRMVAWYGACGENGENASPWTPDLVVLKHKVENETELEFNAVLLNLYRNGYDSVAWHSNKENQIGSNTNIASVTFGQTRPFQLRHKANKEIGQLEIPLHHGTLLLTSGTTNTFWEYHIPKSAKEMLPTVNLTFRQVKV